MWAAISKPHGNHKAKMYRRYTHTQKKMQSKHNNSHQITREENKRGSEEKRPIKTNPKQLTRWQ